MTLSEAVNALCRDVSGIDWSVETVRTDIDTMFAANRQASQAERAAALEILLARRRAGRLEDADGVVNVAICAGALVETGSPARPLAEVMLEKLPDILVAARRFADRCLADLPPDDEDGVDGANAAVWIDGRTIPHDVFDRHIAADHPSAWALHGLER